LVPLREPEEGVRATRGRRWDSFKAPPNAEKHKNFNSLSTVIRV